VKTVVVRLVHGAPRKASVSAVNPKTGTEVADFPFLLSPRRVMVFKPSAILKQTHQWATARLTAANKDRLNDTLNRAIEEEPAFGQVAGCVPNHQRGRRRSRQSPSTSLRFWGKRGFAQIKPMKRSGGRRYYRPDDVDLLRGHPPTAIRRGLYHPRGAAHSERARHRVGPASGRTHRRFAFVRRDRKRAIGQSILEQDGRRRRARHRTSMTTIMRGADGHRFFACLESDDDEGIPAALGRRSDSRRRWA